MKRKRRLIQFLVLKSLETLRARFTMILAPCDDVRSSGLLFQLICLHIIRYHCMLLLAMISTVLLADTM